MWLGSPGFRLVLLALREPILKLRFERSFAGECLLESLSDGRRYCIGQPAVARDLDTWAALFLENGVINPPNEPAVQGRAAIRTWLEKLPQITEFKLRNVQVEGRSGLAYVLGIYSMTVALPAAPGPVVDSGKFVSVVRRQPDGDWLCAVDMFSSDVPAAPAADAAAHRG